jgi:2-oxoglutarate ferredoxin oxidoreductase subunit alpha
MSEGQSSTAKRVEQRDAIVIRFAGDSGDGMQLTGVQFTSESARAGNDLATLPDFPAEIRAPAGTLAGVSAFQLNFSTHQVFTPGDDLDVLVAMNPAALKTNLDDLRPGGILLVDREAFNDGNLRKAGYTRNPLEDDSLAKWQVFPVDITKLTTTALKEFGLSARETFRCRNFFCLGIASWLFHRPLEVSEDYVRGKFKKNPVLVDANLRALHAGWNYAENAELLKISYEVAPAKIAPGVYRNITGNSALALGFVAAAHRAGRPLFLGSYPITPASDILHELSGMKQFDVTTMQAEDEIGGVGAALGAAFGGALAITTTSGPGMDLKAETVGLAVSVELPLVIADIQRSGPSTGMPTKTEQADLLMAMYGRHGEAPVPILAPSTPSDCFEVAYEALRIAAKYMTPVIVLSDAFLANGAEPWLVPDPEKLPEVRVDFRTDPEGFQPYMRDEETLARPWVRPGTPGLEHRVGGLSKESGTGNVSYSPANNEQMARIRHRKVAGIVREIGPTTVFGPASGDLLVLGWGSTFGPIRQAVTDLQREGRSVAHAHLRWLNPLPADLGDVLRRFRHVLVPEMNLGQLVKLIRAEYLVDAIPFNKIQGRPFKVAEIRNRCVRVLEGSDDRPESTNEVQA